MLDLAPDNPYSLLLRSPVLARAGRFGAGVERLAALEGVGGVVSDVLTAGEQAAPGPWRELPGGVLLPDGGRPIGRARRDLARWHPKAARVAAPVIVAVRLGGPGDAETLLGELAGDEWAGLLLDLSGAASVAEARAQAAALRRGWLRPLLAELPLDGPALAELAAALDGLADCLVLGRGPRAAVAADGRLATGRMGGPAAEPALLAGLAELAGATALPLVVGAASVAHALACAALAGGRPLAHLLDAGLWRDPGLAATIAQRRR